MDVGLLLMVLGVMLSGFWAADALDHIRQEIIPTRSICLVYDHHRPLNTAARKFQQLLTASDHKC